ncbi:MAG: hypothetical protein K2Q10_03190, partial [Rhodospirillales bacterium]|nr:hypothetical protein [Rhodospirillales bacterium]
ILIDRLRRRLPDPGIIRLVRACLNADPEDGRHFFPPGRVCRPKAPFGNTDVQVFRRSFPGTVLATIDTDSSPCLGERR